MISNDTALRTGKTALLVCVGFGEPDVEISWSFNGAPVVNTSLVTIYEEDDVQGERIFKQSFLQICSLVQADAGGYTCIASDGFTTDNATTQLTVTSESLGTFCVVCVVVVLFLFFKGNQQQWNLSVDTLLGVEPSCIHVPYTMLSSPGMSLAEVVFCGQIGNPDDWLFLRLVGKIGYNAGLDGLCGVPVLLPMFIC